MSKLAPSRRYQMAQQGPHIIAGLVTLREKVVKPLLAADPTRARQGRKPKSWTKINGHYQTLRITNACPTRRIALRCDINNILSIAL